MKSMEDQNFSDQRDNHSNELYDKIQPDKYRWELWPTVEPAFEPENEMIEFLRTDPPLYKVPQKVILEDSHLKLIENVKITNKDAFIRAMNDFEVIALKTKILKS